MKNSDRFFIGIISAAAIGIIIYLTRKVKISKMLDQIADEGYETAGDILFPIRGRREKRSRRNFNNLSGWDNELFY